ncbi:MAG: Uma2 family endonuclease [Bacteroidota bacterium]
MAQPIERGKGYTYADYLTWDDGRRWEIIDGVAYEKIEGPSIVSDMSPAPNRFHQTIVTNLIREIGNYLKGKEGNIFSAPFDVRLQDSEKLTIVQPDVSIFCNSEHLNAKGASGPPDWIIEILSPSTSTKDLGKKILLYQKFGVREYWIIHPDEKFVSVHILAGDGRYDVGKDFESGEKISPTVFSDLQINLPEIFAA